MIKCEYCNREFKKLDIMFDLYEILPNNNVFKKKAICPRCGRFQELDLTAKDVWSHETMSQSVHSMGIDVLYKMYSYEEVLELKDKLSCVVHGDNKDVWFDLFFDKYSKITSKERRQMYVEYAFGRFSLNQFAILEAMIER